MAFTVQACLSRPKDPGRLTKDRASEYLVI